MLAVTVGTELQRPTVCVFSVYVKANLSFHTMTVGVVFRKREDMLVSTHVLSKLGPRLSVIVFSFPNLCCKTFEFYDRLSKCQSQHEF